MSDRNKQKKQKIFNQAFSDHNVDKDNYPISLYNFGRDVLEDYETKYTVDLDIQRNRYFLEHHQLSYYDSRFWGSAMNPYIMVSIDEVRRNVQSNQVECYKYSEDYEYYSRLWDKYFVWLSIDGNNRIGADLNYWRDGLVIPKGNWIPLIENDKRHFVELPRSMNRTGIVNEYGEEYLRWEKSSYSDMDIKRIKWSTKANLHLIFRNVNQVKELNKQEDRNCINSNVAKTVRIYANGKIGGVDNWLQTQYTESNSNIRNHEAFVAFIYTYINNFDGYFGKSILFGNVGKRITDNQVTMNYENDTIDDTVIKKADKAIERLKDYVENDGAGVEWIDSSGNGSLAKALTCWFYSLNEEYSKIQWDEVYEYAKNTIKYWMDLKDENGEPIYYKMPSLTNKRTFEELTKTGSSVAVPVLYSFLKSEEVKMMLNGMMHPNLKRAYFGIVTRQELYDRQNKISPFTNKKIVGYNDKSKYVVDHIIPISQWTLQDIIAGKNPNDIDNLQLGEKEPNWEKGSKIPESKLITTQQNMMGI
jgi:hypothetical protein